MSHTGVVRIRNNKAVHNLLITIFQFKKCTIPCLICLYTIFSSTLCYAEDTSPFSIYLSPDKDYYAAEDIDKVKLNDKPIITMDDVISYSNTRDVLELTLEAYKRFMEAGTGTVFVVCVGKNRIYAGAIWSGLLSQSWPGVVVLKPKYPVPTDSSGVIRFELGYPTEEYFEGKDRRSDPRIIRAFEEADKLSNFSYISLALYIIVAAIVVKLVARFAPKIIKASSNHRQAG